MNSIITAQGLRELLQQQRDIASQLLQVLSQEFAALSGNDLQELETTLAAKQELMQQLEERSRNFLAWANQAAAGNKKLINKFLKDKDPQGTWELTALWRQVDELLSQCRHKNSTNGKIISLSHRHVQQALEILRCGGQDSQPCYSPTGAGQSSAASRILGKV